MCKDDSEDFIEAKVRELSIQHYRSKGYTEKQLHAMRPDLFPESEAKKHSRSKLRVVKDED